MAQETTRTTRRGLLDPERAAAILKVIPPNALDTQRRMGYFVEPRWKRLSEYEALTCYSQPTPDWIPGGLDWGDWTQKFHGGRPSWGNELTELRSSDWHKHRDPARRWHHPYVKNKSEEAGYTQRFLQGYSAEGQIRTMDPFWRDEMISKYWGAMIFNEYGMFNAHSSVVRDCLGDTIRSSATFAAFDKNDNAQMIQMERVFISKVLSGFPESTDEPKLVWTTDPVYRGARVLIEELWQGIQDFNEILWSTHCVYDPLFGQFVRREFFLRLAPFFGDSLTPFFINQTQTYFQTTRDAMSDLYLTTLCDDMQFSSLNRRFLRLWTDKWLSQTVTALKDFMGLYDKVPVIAGVTDEASVKEALTRVFSDWVHDYVDKIDGKVDTKKIIDLIMTGYK
ncbi:MAG: hypothetical protein PHT60_07065 [Acidiphilium sp.]|nr:hypothetical protein [Acidiphilium sp.]MDD4935522.1 hypothetical protein [Acidiphilium sp.]